MTIGASLGGEPLCVHPYNPLRPHHNWCGLLRERSSDLFGQAAFTRLGLEIFSFPAHR
jgi:hypothetical protein